MVIQELLIYILLIGRWLSDKVTREVLSQQLIGFLATASDIMELYALFDESAIQTNYLYTCVVLGVWSVSFLQFFPVLGKLLENTTDGTQKSSKRRKRFKVSEMIECLFGVFLQDGPFLCVRLFVMVNLDLVTYSLVFFVIKNLVSLVLLLYRIIVLLTSK